MLNQNGEKKQMIYPTKIILHCSATPEGVDFGAIDIDKWHKQRGFKKIGYHYVIRLNGTIEKGREENEMGSHCLNQNLHSIGICYIGGLSKDKKTPKDTRTEEQKIAIKGLVNSLIRKYRDKEGIELSVHGHNEFARKACPCYNVQEENILNNWR